MAKNEVDFYIDMLAAFEQKFGEKTADLPEFYEQWEGSEMNKFDFYVWRNFQERVKILVAKLKDNV